MMLKHLKIVLTKVKLYQLSAIKNFHQMIFGLSFLHTFEIIIIVILGHFPFDEKFQSTFLEKNQPCGMYQNFRTYPTRN